MLCMNMQAVCKSDNQFSAVTCKHVGCINDANAFETCSLKGICESLPFPFHWNGDPAYLSSRTMVIPYPRTNLHIEAPYLEAFNFYQSQIRILIKFTFGIFVRRWGILLTALGFDLDFQFEIIHALCRLHNFCIQQKLPIINDRPGEPITVDGRLSDPSWRASIKAEALSNSHGSNAVRDDITEKIEALDLRRVRSHHS
jgi:hypothetical protein